jgi:hypothetical protein
VVAEGDAEDVGGEIFEGGLAATGGLTVHDPMLAPDGGRDRSEQRGLFQAIAELGAEDLAQSFDRKQKLGVLGWKPLALGRKATGGNQIMDMWMIVEIAGPGL